MQVKYQKNKNEKIKWFFLLFFYVVDSNGEFYWVYFFLGFGLVEVVIIFDKFLEFWECIEVIDEKFEGNEEFGFQIRCCVFYLVN